MSRQVMITFAVLAALVPALAGCTSGSANPGPTGSHRSSTGTPPGTLTGTAPTEPTASVVASCAPSSTELTYHRRFLVVSGEQYGLPPSSHATLGKGLPVQTTVVARAPGLGTGSGLIPALKKHWHSLVFGLGTSSTQASSSTTIGLSNRHGKKNVVYAVYRFTHEFTGTFSSSCGGHAVTGRYRTFGPFSTVVVGCADKITGKLDRIGHQQFCR